MDALDAYLAAKPAPDPLDAYLAAQQTKKDRIARETAAGQTAPPTFLQKLGSAAFGQDVEPTYDKKAPDLGMRALSGALRLTGAGSQGADNSPEGVRDQIAGLEARNPGQVDALRGMQEVQHAVGSIPLAGAAGKAVEAGVAALPTLARAAPYVADAAAGMTAAGATEAASGASPGDVATRAVQAAGPSMFLGKGLRALSGGAGAGAEAIKQSPTTTGADIRVLEKHGFEPTPVPLRPVARMEEPPPVGPRAPESPSRTFGVQATSEGRGIVGTRSAAALKNELDAQDAVSKGRSRAAARRFNRPGGEGSRDVSVEPLISQAEGEGQSITAQMNPTVAGGVKRLQEMLRGRLEPTAEIYSTDPFPYRNRPGVADVEVPERSIPDEVVASAGGEPPIEIGMGDVHGRVGDAPNHVRTASELNQIRDALDEAGNVAAKEGMKKEELPFARLAGTIREKLIPENAPAIARANRRAHARMNRVERGRELMKDAESESPESLGMQLAGQGEAGSKVSGGRTDRLERLRQEFPVSSRMDRAQVDRAIDAPRLLLAEERLQLKKLPRIGGGGTDAFNLSEPAVGRLVYPGLRGVEAGAREAAPYAPGLLEALRRAHERERRARR